MIHPPSTRRKFARIPKPLSDKEVSRFLKHLAAGYRDKRTGNPLLADALVRVANTLLDRGSSTQSVARADSTQNKNQEFALNQSAPRPFEGLSADDVAQFISDTTKTKSHLIELAAARFGIPRSKLMRLPIDLVREAVRSALMHETSLAVITEEAARYGTRRQS